MSADELEARDRRERTRVEVLDACKGRWVAMRQLRAELPHIPYRKLQHQLQWLVQKGFLWKREVADPAPPSTLVHEYRCKFV